MEALFLKLLNMSISAGWLVLAVLVLRMAFKRAPKFISVILWGFVAVRLICPFSINSVFSLIPSAETVPNDIMYMQTPQIYSGISQVNTAVNNIVLPALTPDVSDSINPMQTVVFVASIVWLIGVAVMLLYTLFSYLRVHKTVSEAVALQENIMICDHISTPFILGILKPRIFLPSSMNDEDKEYVIAHEKAHLKRRDHLWKPLGFLLLTVYWFNPIIWAGYIFLCHDIEHACDERVIKEMGIDNKKPYSHALINCSPNRRSIMSCPLAFGEVNLKNRINVVLNYKKPVFWVMVLSVVLSAVVAVCFLTNPVGIKITDLHDQGIYNKIFDNVDGVTVILGDEHHIVTDDEAIEKIITSLDAVRLRTDPVSKSRAEDRDMTNRIKMGSNILCFNKDFTEFWIMNGVKPTYSYKVHDPLIAEMAFLIHDEYKTTAIPSEFSVGTDVYGLTISIKDIELNVDNPYIEIQWKNETDKEYSFGETFDIAYKKSNTFSSCATKVMYFDTVAYSIKPNETKTKMYYLSDFDLSRDGVYRFETSVTEDFDLWIDFKLKNQTADEMRDSMVEEGTQAVKIKELREKYPQYFNLPIENGLEVYVVLLKSHPAFPISEDYYLFSGNNLGYEWAQIEGAEGVTQDEMKLILSTYKDISSADINLVVKNHPLALYMVDVNDGYVANIRTALNIYNAQFDSHLQFKATVLEVRDDGTILVEAFEDEAIRNLSDQFILDISQVYNNNDRPIKQGDKLRIAYMGGIKGDSPATIADIRAVALIGSGQ